MNKLSKIKNWLFEKPLRWMVLLVALIVLITGGIYASKKNTVPKTAQNTDAKAALTVSVEQVTMGSMPQSIDANGDVKAWEEAVIAAQTSGLRISVVHKSVGDVINKGDVLAEFSAESVTARLAAQKASVAEAQALVEQAKADADRANKLRDSGAISKQQYTQLQIALRTSQARLDVAKSQLDINKVDLNQTKIIAPDSGVISSKSAVLGLVPAPGQELFRFVRQSKVEWYAQVTAEQLQQVRVGMKAQVFTMNNQPVDGTVRSVSPTLDAKTRNGTVIVSISDSSELKSGMFVKGRIELGEGTGLTVTESSVVQRDGFSYVFVVDEKNIAKQVQIETGRRQNGRIEVKTGLTDGMSVVSKGAGFLKDGDKVNVVPADDLPATPMPAAGAPAVTESPSNASVVPNTTPNTQSSSVVTESVTQTSTVKPSSDKTTGLKVDGSLTAGEAAAAASQLKDSVPVSEPARTETHSPKGKSLTQ